MKKLLEKKENNRSFYFYKKEYLHILEEILKLNYEIIKEFKNDNRTYVAKILINRKYYILKKIYNNKKLKKYFSFFKDGESLLTLKNVNFCREKGLNELLEVYGVVLERKNGIIVNEFFIMEYFEGKKATKDSELLKIIPVLDKIYLLKRFHGDCNPGNFILDNQDNVKVLDTKLKRMIFGNYRQHYDLLTLMKHFNKNIIYPYKKNIYYYLAFFIRKVRNLKNFLGRYL